MWEFPVISYNTYNNKIIQIKGVQVLLWEVRIEYNQVLLNGPQYFLLSFPYTKITLELWSSIYSDTLYVIIKRAVGIRKELCNQLIILFYKALFFPKTLNMQIYKNQYVLIKSISVNPQLVWFYCLISPISDENCWFLTFPKTYPLCVTNVCRSPSFLNISTTISIGVWSVIVTGAWKQ